EQLPPDTSLSLDKGDLGLVQAHVQAWQMVDKTADYGCVIQDDVILTSDFIPKAQYHVEQGHKLYGKLSYHFYLRNKPTLAKYRNYDKGHVCLDGLYSGNSIVLPTDWISPMLDSFAKSKKKGGDRKINEY